jgi:BirA family biotin operon repressor/biotin-[acetyl-CoA-carboxylase] ligase
VEEAKIPADIAPEVITAALRSRVIGRPLEVVAEVASTNDHAMAAGRAGRPEGLAVLADRQTAGRGRKGRVWASPAGVGVYTSILLRPTQPPARVPILALVAGLGVLDAVGEVCGLPARLKWPNDVLVAGRKVAGILAETATADERVSHVVVGLGINVNHGPAEFAEGLSPRAISLAMAAGRAIPRGELAAALYNSLDRWYAIFQEGGLASILAAGRERSATLGRPVEVLGDEERWQGLAVDLDVDGALLVREGGGELRRVLAGDVSIRTRE